MNRFQRYIIYQQIVALRVLTFALVHKRLIELLSLVDNDKEYNTADQLLSENGVTYSYDLNGNLVTKSDSSGVTGYTYDYDNRLTSVSAPSGSVSYKYDADGNRVEQATSSGTVRYLVDTNRSLAQVLAEYTPSGALIASYVYADDLISMSRGGQLYFYHFDGLGSTRLLTDGAGAVTDTYDYDAFGNIIARTGNTPNEFLFTGQQYDANTGFYYLRARYYQPSNGRFTAYDPFEGDPYAPMSLHKYLYAGDDPINKIDPSGRTIVLPYLGGLLAMVLLMLAMYYAGVGSRSIRRVNTDSDDSDDLVYRGLGISENMITVRLMGIFSKGWWEYSPSEHIEKTRDDSWWISTSRSVSRAAYYATGPNGSHKIAVIDLNRIDPSRIFETRFHMHELSDDAQERATVDQEVLIKRWINPYAIRRVIDAAIN